MGVAEVVIGRESSERVAETVVVSEMKLLHNAIGR